MKFKILDDDTNGGLPSDTSVTKALKKDARKIIWLLIAGILSGLGYVWGSNLATSIKQYHNMPSEIDSLKSSVGFLYNDQKHTDSIVNSWIQHHTELQDNLHGVYLIPKPDTTLMLHPYSLREKMMEDHKK